MQLFVTRTKLSRKVRVVAGGLAILSGWAAQNGPLDGSRLALLLNWGQVVVALVLGLTAIGWRLHTSWEGKGRIPIGTKHRDARNREDPWF